jgi:hypothetical protein
MPLNNAGTMIEEYLISRSFAVVRHDTPQPPRNPSSHDSLDYHDLANEEMKTPSNDTTSPT